jgi:signal transduction histidine kinase
MSPEILNSLFKIGETISSKGTNNEIGSGIGLLLCQEFIGKHQGQIEVESEEGKGSAFKLHLPLKINQNEQDAVLN